MKKIKLIAVAGVILGLVFTGIFAGEIRAEAQEKCPVMGLKVDPKVYTEHEGKRINFCCSHCIEQFKADPAKYLNKTGAAKPAK